jgi:hypothetical protein
MLNNNDRQNNEKNSIITIENTKIDMINLNKDIIIDDKLMISKEKDNRLIKISIKSKLEIINRLDKLIRI